MSTPPSESPATQHRPRDDRDGDGRERDGRGRDGRGRDGGGRSGEVAEVVARLGGVASTPSLAAEGVSAVAMTDAVRHGALMRVRQGWLALPSADRAIAAAVRVGGSLSCTSVLRRYGIWCAHDRQLHVRVSPAQGRLASPFDRARPLRPGHAVVAHRPGWASPITTAVDDLATALALAVQCQPRLDAIASLDSALQRGLATPATLGEALAPLPGRHRALLALVDGSAQSGLESKARMSLRGLRVRVRSQVEIDGVGHVDLLVGDRLVIELDGYQHHSGKKEFEEDRRRDLVLNRRDYRVIRLSYDQVTWQWPACEAVLLDLIRRREHLWPRRASSTA